MILYSDACKIVSEFREKEWPEFPYVSAYELVDRWAFILSVFPPDSEECMLQPPSFFVDKESGHLEMFTIPPLENLELLWSGEKIRFNDSGR